MTRPILRVLATVTLVSALVLTLASGPSAASSTVSVTNLRGPLLNAWFTSFDNSGCVETDTFVSANRPTDQQLPAARTTVGLSAASIYRYDWCTDTAYVDAAGENDNLGAADLFISRQLDQGSLHTTIPLDDLVSGSVIDVAIDVTWTGTSDIHRDHENTNDLYGGGCHVLNRWKGSGRTATAWGTVSDGSTNYAPEATDQAEIGFVIDGFEVINCP